MRDNRDLCRREETRFSHQTRDDVILGATIRRRRRTSHLPDLSVWPQKAPAVAISMQLLRRVTGLAVERGNLPNSMQRDVFRFMTGNNTSANTPPLKTRVAPDLSEAAGAAD